MALGRVAEWHHDSYEPEHVEAIIRELGITIAARHAGDFLCFCPFHDNTDTPAFSVSWKKGLYFCFNPDCQANAGGTFVELVVRLSGKDKLQALRHIKKRQSETYITEDVLKDMFNEDRLPLLPQMKIDELKEALWEHQPAVDYLHARGFEDKTIRHFECGWSNIQKMVVTPVINHDGQPLGFNGRSITEKKFKLHPGIPRNKVLFNLNNAKRYPIVVVCESQFDTMRIHQSGYPNAVCSLGSYISDKQFQLLNRFFDGVVIMTDADKAGRKMGHNLAAALRNKRVRWAMWDDNAIYPHGAKDAGDMTDEEIKHCIDNAVSHVEYVSLARAAGQRV